MSLRNRPGRSRPRPIAGSRRAPARLTVEVSANAPAAVLAAAQEAVRVLAPLAAIELVRVPPQPGDEELRIRGPLVAWNAPAVAARRQYRAVDTFAAAFEAALADCLAADDEALEVALEIIHDGGHDGGHRPRAGTTEG